MGWRGHGDRETVGLRREVVQKWCLGEREEEEEGEGLERGCGGEGTGREGWGKRRKERRMRWDLAIGGEGKKRKE